MMPLVNLELLAIFKGIYMNVEVASPGNEAGSIGVQRSGSNVVGRREFFDLGKTKEERGVKNSRQRKKQKKKQV